MLPFAAGLFALLPLLVLLSSGCGEAPQSTKSTTETTTKPEHLAEPTLDPSKVPFTSFFPMKGPEKREYMASRDLKTARVDYSFQSPGSSGSIRYQHVTGTSHEFDKPSKEGEPAPPPKATGTVKETYFWHPDKGLLLQPGTVTSPAPYALRILPNKWSEEARWEDTFTLKDNQGRTAPGKAIGKIVGTERVATPAGDFDAIHTEITRVVGSGTGALAEQFDFWFAKDIGIVKAVFVSRAGKMSMLLSKRGS
jgi:hypothetical protein